nr:MAG TPA: hypothetical protein [Caudoviricetes sp.]
MKYKDILAYTYICIQYTYIKYRILQYIKISNITKIPSIRQFKRR